jgi:hypothetical protein
VFWSVALLFSGLASCGRSINPGPANSNLAESQLPIPATFAQIPQASGPRAARNSSGYFAGQDYARDLINERVSEFSPSIKFIPYKFGAVKSEDQAYCIYRLPVDDEGPLQLILHWNTPPPADRLFLAFANFSTNRWDWQALTEHAAAIRRDEYESYISAQDTVLIAVLVAGNPLKDDPDYEPVLDYLHLESLSDSGWRHLELFSEEIIQEENRIASVQPFEYKGKPAVFFYSYTAASPSAVNVKSYLAFSSSSTGTDMLDWQVQDVKVAGEYKVGSMTEVTGGLAFCWSDYLGAQGPVDLHYSFSSDDGQNFNNTVVHTATAISPVKLAAVNGNPVIGFGANDAPATSLRTVYCACADDAEATNWTIAPVHDTDLAAFSASTAIANPTGFEGKPVLAYYSSTDDELKVAIGKKEIPESAADWQIAALGSSVNQSLGLLEKNGKLGYYTARYIAFAPDQCEFWTHMLTGTDPSLVENWNVQSFNALGLNQSTASDFTWLDNELWFLHLNTQTGSNIGDNSLQTLELWQSASPSNDIAAWNTEIFSTENESRYMMKEINGQLVIAQHYSRKLGYEESRWQTKLVWSVYLP